jgi:hypothetical protein
MMTRELNVIQPTATRCRNLLSKGLYINHGLPPGKEVAGDGNFWCSKTQRTYGPDKKLCDLAPCCNAERSCYEG